MIMLTTLTSKGQLTLPVKIRKRLGLETGDTVIFEYVGDQVVMRKAGNIENYFDSLPPLDFSFKEKLEETIAADSWSH
jgi:AbrB family looped-hinge helix DNA binding protein